MKPTLTETESFDREYPLEELLPETVLDPLMETALPMADGFLWILGTDGGDVYRQGDWSPELSASVKAALRGAGRTPFEASTGAEIATFFPIIHEIAPIGYLVLVGAALRTEKLGRFLGSFLGRLAQANCRSLMATGIHGQVVTENHRNLMEKTAQLEVSEKKYRRLAANLQKEVARQTRKIQMAQVRFMHQEKLASIGHLAAGVAHEINNPMGFISSNLNTLVDYQKDFKALVRQYRELVAAAKEETGQCTDLVAEKIEAINRLEQEVDLDFLMSDCSQLVHESLEGAERIRKIVADLKDFAHPGERNLQLADINRSIDVTLGIAANELKYNTQVIRDYGTLPQVLCYPQQLNQVFLNMLINAAQSIEAQGEIRIRTRSVGPFVEIEFSDNGCGIPAETVSKIFDPFFTTKPVGKGTGLGLNVVHNIIQKHRGTIRVQSQPGRGTTFNIRIPVSPPDPGIGETSCPD